MTERLVDVEARISTVHKLTAVISVMRGIAASRAREARHRVDSIRLYAKTIGDAIGHALASLPEADRIEEILRPTGDQIVCLIAAEQGFAGAFTARIFEAATGLMDDPHELFIVGDRGGLMAEERGLAVSWSAPMIAHPAQASALATSLTEAIYARMALSQIERVSLIHALPGKAGTIEVIEKMLVPFDYSRFPTPKSSIPPHITLPPEKLLARLVEEYVFAEFSEALMLSFSAENEARMRAMIAAHDNVSDTLSTLTARARRLRQQEITEEIVELATGSLSA